LIETRGRLVKMNSQYFNHLIAVFFANEFLSSILPSSSNSKKKIREEVLREYRENIDNYCNSTTGFMQQTNPAYETVLSKLVSFVREYVPMSRDGLIKFGCDELCSKNIREKLSERERSAIFRKYLTESIKAFTAQTLVQSNIYVDFIIGAKTDKGEARMFQKKIVTSFEVILNEHRNQIFSEFSCLENGRDPVTVISLENQKLEELRVQNEELRFENLRLREENFELKRKLVTPVLQPPDDEAEDEEDD